MTDIKIGEMFYVLHNNTNIKLFKILMSLNDRNIYIVSTPKLSEQEIKEYEEEEKAKKRELYLKKCKKVRCEICNIELNNLSLRSHNKSKKHLLATQTY